MNIEHPTLDPERKDTHTETRSSVSEYKELQQDIHITNITPFEDAAVYIEGTALSERVANDLLFITDPVDKELVKRGLLAYITAPIIEDTFTDHTERRSWRKTLSPKLQELYERNKLSRNNITQIFNIATIRKNRFPEEVLEVVEHIRHRYFGEHAEKNYDVLSQEEKLIIIDDMQEIAKELYRHFIAYYRTVAQN